MKASNNDGVWSERSAECGFTISPPFWLTWWFRSLIALTVLLLTVMVYHLRTRAIREHSKQLETRVEERTEALREEIKERKRAEREIEKRQKYLESVLHATPSAIVTADDSGLVVEWNPGAEKIFGYTRKEMLHRNVDEIIVPEEKMEEAAELTGQTLSGSAVTPMETIRRRKDGKPIHVIIGVSPIRNGTKLHGIVAVYTDITDLKRVEDQLKASLSEKEVLLKEIHHRVKNNFQIISSLLNLQSKLIRDDHALEVFKESKNRIRSMALIHEKLYQSKNLAQIDFANYIKTLVSRLYQSYSTDSNAISLVYDVEQVSIRIDDAIPCGLVINELISNSLKYGFPSDWKGKGKIRIALHQKEKGQVELAISDNGIGLPEAFDVGKPESLGLRLVHILVDEQLGGKTEIDRRKGTRFKIVFQKS